MINKLTPICAKRGNALILQRPFESSTKHGTVRNREGPLREGSLAKSESKAKLLSETFRQACGAMHRKGFRFDPYKASHKKLSSNTSVVKYVTGTIEIASSISKLKENLLRQAKSLKVIKKERGKGSFTLRKLKKVLEKTVMKRIRSSKMSDILSRNISNQLKNTIKSGKISAISKNEVAKRQNLMPHFTEDQLLVNFAKKPAPGAKSPKPSLGAGQADYNNIEIRREFSLSSRHGAKKKVQKRAAESQFKAIDKPPEVNASPAIQTKSDEFSAQPPKKEVNLLDKLRNVSRSAYSVGSLYNLPSNS